VGDLVGQKYRLRIELPLPFEILSLRCGLLFSRTAEGNVRDSIKKECENGGKNKQLALVTCFRYPEKKYSCISSGGDT